jgi:hypothetical protein
VADARRAAVAGRAREAADRLSGALNLWRGHALADLRDFRFAADRAVALEEQRLTCLESWADAQLASGRADSLVPQLQELVIAHPTRERLWEQLMLALYRTGRQDAALSAYRTARATLDRELGVEPSTRLTSLHQAILVHDPKLRPGSAVTGPPGGMLSSTTLVRSEPTPTPAVLVGPGGRRVSLAGAAVVLGRHRDCDLVLTDGQASRRHARVEPVPAGYALVDLGSTNGTFLNDRRVAQPVEVHAGDVVKLGKTVLELRR